MLSDNGLRSPLTLLIKQSCFSSLDSPLARPNGTRFYLLRDTQRRRHHLLHAFVVHSPSEEVEGLRGRRAFQALAEPVFRQCWHGPAVERSPLRPNFLSISCVMTCFSSHSAVTHYTSYTRMWGTFVYLLIRTTTEGLDVRCLGALGLDP